MKNQTITNQQAMNIEQSACVYRINQSNNSQIKFRWRGTDPALSTDVSHGFSKAAFIKAHRDGENIESFAKAYSVSQQKFRNTVRTVGTGTHLLIRNTSDGDLFNALVARTAHGEDGTVNLGKHSRAAGGAKGGLSLSNYRELQEEFICARTKDGEVIIYDVDYEDDVLPHHEKQNILNRKRFEIKEILSVNGVECEKIKYETLTARVVSVPGFTQTITQDIDGATDQLRHRVLHDSPNSGDFAACDIILYAELPRDIAISDILIFDGERDQSGNLLNRKWILDKPEAWLRKINDGLPISPAAKPVYDNWSSVSQSVRRLTT